MFKNIKNTIILITAIISIYIVFLIITKPYESLNKIDTILYKITGHYYLTNTNEKINKEEIIAIAKNKDYSKSIYYPYYELLNINQKKYIKTLFRMQIITIQHFIHLLKLTIMNYKKYLKLFYMIILKYFG